MGRYVTIEFSDGTQIGGGWRGKCDFPGTFVFKPGDKCVVQPPNSKKKKHRGRECCLLDAYSEQGSVRVLFLDTDTRGTVNVGDLVPVGEPG